MTTERFPTPIFDRELEEARKRGDISILHLSRYRRNKPPFFWFLMFRPQLLAAALSDALARKNITDDPNANP
jgi:hypothetical protein